MGSYLPIARQSIVLMLVDNKMIVLLSVEKLLLELLIVLLSAERLLEVLLRLLV